MHNYLNISKDNPFASQSKLVKHIDRLYEFLYFKDTTPIFMEVNLTNKCNLKCKWCIAGNRENNSTELHIDKLKLFIESFSSMNGKALTFSGGGEPTLYTHFEEVVNCSLQNNIELGLMTNGLFNSKVLDIIDGNFKWIRVSLDTVNEEKYTSFKEVNAVKSVLKNIKKLYKRQNTKVGVNCNIVDDYSIDDIKELIDTVINDCNYIQFRPVLPRYFKEDKTTINNDVWDYLFKTYENNPKINLSNDKYLDIVNKQFFPFQNCEGHYFTPVLDANGNIDVCMYHTNDNNFTFGNIDESSFENIWKSEQRKKVIEFVNGIDYKKNCQVCCKLTEINKLIDFFKFQNIEDENFI